MRNKQLRKEHQKNRRAYRTRARISGTAERPRLSVHRTLKHISAQLINDVDGTTLAAVNDADAKGTGVEKAAAVGIAIAEAAKKAGVETVVFDRGAFKYHGRVKALADAARENGLTF